MTIHTSPAIERLLAQAYDAEQAGQPLEAAELRTKARGLAAQFDQLSPQARAFCQQIETIVEGLPADQRAASYGAITGTLEVLEAEPVERQREIFRMFDQALGLDDDEKRYDPQIDCTVWERGNTALYYGHEENRITTVAALGTVGDIDDLEDLLDLVALLDRPDVRAAIGGRPQPAVDIEYMHGDLGANYLSFIAGEGLTRALIGDYNGDKPGLELIIGGNAINDKLDEVITLDDVRQLRDNLTALIEDGRLVAHLETGASPLCAPPDVRQPSASRPAYPDGEYIDPIQTPLGTVGNVACERIDMSPDRAWLSFESDIVLIDVNILGGDLGADLVINGYQVSEPGMTRAQLEQVRDALIDLLEDQRLLDLLP